MSRLRCARGGHWVEADQVVPVSPIADECMSGPGVMRLACRDCLASDATQPATNLWIGRRDGSPSPPGDAQG